jgi:hypothetical protein
VPSDATAVSLSAIARGRSTGGDRVPAPSTRAAPSRQPLGAEGLPNPRPGNDRGVVCSDQRLESPQLWVTRIQAELAGLGDPQELLGNNVGAI